MEIGVVKVKPVGNHELYLVLFNHLNHRLTIAFARGHGFFAKDMAAGAGSALSVFAVKRVWSGNVNGIHILAFDRRFHIFVGVSLHAVALAQLLDLIRTSSNQRHQF